MKQKFKLQGLLCSLFIFCFAGCGGSSSNSNSTPAPSESNYKKVVVFGIELYATSSLPDEKLLHAANIMAEYLDNNEDGVVDDAAVLDQMVQNKAHMIMPNTEAEISSFDMSILPANGEGQDLYGEETHINGAAQGRFDASLEEVLHLITHVGYANAYPSAFGEFSGTLLAEAMDVARGGHFEQIPATYPESAWYTYDDQTCDYSCQTTEYLYWALTSILGGQSFDGRLENIQHEWKLNTREKVEATDTLVFQLLTNGDYLLPTRLPDGNYAAQSFEIVRL